MKALIVVDMQKDFMPGGSLAVKDGDEIIGRVNQLIAKYRSSGDIVVYTKDAHPENHCSFKNNGGIWPVHCVPGTEGYRFHDNLVKDLKSFVFDKGSNVLEDSYSGFGGLMANLTLERYLKENKVTKVLVVGLALDYCVKATALDAAKLGFATTVDLKATKAVNISPGDDTQAIEELKANGVKIVGA